MKQFNGKCGNNKSSHKFRSNTLRFILTSFDASMREDIDPGPHMCNDLQYKHRAKKHEI